MKRLMIADSSEPFTAALVDAFSYEFETRTCADGDTALELLLSFQPDLLIINLQLPYKDGLTVLQEAAYRPPVILATTSYTNPYIEHTAASLGIGYTMISPAINALRVRLMDMVHQRKNAGGTSDLQSETVTHLHILNFMTHLDGYHQLCVGIPLFYQNPQQRLMKELYPTIASICGSTDERSVEHSIRKAIEASWKVCNQTVWAKYFPAGPNGQVSCPTNKEFISRIAEFLYTEKSTPGF